MSRNVRIIAGDGLAFAAQISCFEGCQAEVLMASEDDAGMTSLIGQVHGHGRVSIAGRSEPPIVALVCAMDSG